MQFCDESVYGYEGKKVAVFIFIFSFLKNEASKIFFKNRLNNNDHENEKNTVIFPGNWENEMLPLISYK